MMIDSLGYPVLILTFNRPELFQGLLQLVAKVNPTAIYVGIDGPRPDNETDHIAKNEILGVLEGFDSPCPVYILERSSNLGCKIAVSKAISWFFSFERAGIILEDDCFPTEAFFDFCARQLHTYEHDTTVFSVGGYRAFRSSARSGLSVFTRYPQIWGWATWSHVWEKYDASLKDWKDLKARNWLKHEVKLNPIARFFWAQKFDLCQLNQIDTWDYQLAFLAFKMKASSILPPQNLVRNVGFDVRATHTNSRAARRANHRVYETTRFINPDSTQPNRFHDLWLEFFSYRTVHAIVWRALKKLVTPVLG